MDTLHKLEEIFKHFPGIGPRQAKRFAYYLLSLQEGELQEFSKHILSLKQSVHVCELCQRFFPLQYTNQGPVCSICSDPNRDTSTLMIVSRDIDMQAVERSRAYSGVYFVLGGSIPILEESPEKKIRQQELLTRVRSLCQTGLKEIILATSVNPEGEHTATYIQRLLKPEIGSIKISTLGRGLSTGTELEYSDSETLKSALQNRR